MVPHPLMLRSLLGRPWCEVGGDGVISSRYEGKGHTQGSSEDGLGAPPLCLTATSLCRVSVGSCPSPQAHVRILGHLGLACG